MKIAKTRQVYSCFFDKVACCDQCGEDILMIASTDADLPNGLGMIYAQNNRGKHVLPAMVPPPGQSYGDAAYQSMAKHYFHRRAQDWHTPHA